ncbi:hypothetical protein NEF87_003170 [Candidatus Lokiarchaeum ossiferum]|uniref:DUF5320 domain-containing protein n=1 Tax=Candidatus Lokiarchaeum ossiferum TaxID=2951803 RepID=A0ABY6HTP3_9ARCH|nr:hypothetical protein NEF87_003170 [Candidatus Lokiarchaeum sp. B-35]
MPSGDGTGPNGRGPMTGRALGPCNGNIVPGYGRGLGYGRGGGFGRGRGMGYGRGSGYGGGYGRGRSFAYPPVQYTPSITPFDEETQLKNLELQKNLLANDMQALETEIERLKNKQ